MAEETPKEAQPEPVQQNLSEIVGRLVEAHELSKTATKYTRGSADSPVNIVSGSSAKPNPTLYQYIQKAEKIVIQEMQQLIIDKARGLIGIELDKIRGMVG